MLRFLIVFISCAGLAISATKLAVIGDSISTGEGAKDPGLNGYPSLLGDLLGPDYEVKAFARGGRTLLRKGDNPLMKEAVYLKALEFKPDMAIIMLGTNDTSVPRGNWKHHGELESDLMHMIEDLRKVNPEVLIHISGPLPLFPDKKDLKPERIEDMKQRAENVKTIWKTYEQVADREERVFFHDLNRVLKADDTTDGVHPNDLGHAKLARHMNEIIRMSIEEGFDLLPKLKETTGKVDQASFGGYARYNFKLPDTDVSAVVVEPRQAASGHPWVWRARFFGHQPELDLQLLDRGWHIVYVDVANLYGSEKALQRWDMAYDFFTGELGLSRKVVLEGMSRGGLPIFRWGIRHPDRVAAIYGDNPVCDFRTWPGGHDGGRKSKGDWDRLLKVWNLTEEQALKEPQTPELLEPLAKARVPVALVLGLKDNVVPVASNGELLAKKYEALGGPVKVWRKPGDGHHPHGLHPPDELRRFLIDAVAGE